MLSKIIDENEKAVYLKQLKELDEIFAKQSLLPKDARVNKSILLKLEQLYQFLENEILKYDKINE